MSDYCAPAFLYFVISTLGVLGSLFMGGDAATMVMSFVWIVVFSYLLNWLCSNGYFMLSWVLVLLPLLLSLFVLITLITVKAKNSISSPSISPTPSPSPSLSPSLSPTPSPSQ